MSGGDGHHHAAFVAVGGDDGVPAAAGGDDGVQLPQNRRGDHRLGLGDGEPVVLSGGQVGESGGVDGVGALRASHSPPCRQPQPGPSLPGQFRAADEVAG